jgi:signal transduction histidine kinase
VIIGHSDWMLSSLPEDHPLRENADAVQKAAARAAMLTRQLTAYGRKQLLRPEILDLDRVIHGMNEMFHHLLPTNVTLEIAPCGRAPMVKADSGQLEQVIMNLVVNAIDAMPLGGALSLRTSTFFQESAETEFNLELAPGKYVQLAITDSGTGMTDVVKSRVFEPFFTTKEVGHGTGLGLAASYGIIKQSGGHIEVSSEIGKGSCFKIYLPLVEVAQPVAP